MSKDSAWNHRIGWIILAFAALLRGCQALLRWDEVSWLYSAYSGATTDALESGDLVSALTTFTGLHPPLWPLLHGTMELWMPVPMLWLLGSALASWGAVWLVLRQSLWAGALMAFSPIQLHYAAEVNDYPLATLWVALAWTGYARARAKNKWGLLALAGILGLWTHLLAGALIAIAALSLPRTISVRVFGLMLMSSLPLIPGALELLQEGGTTTQPPLKPALILTDYLSRFGPFALLAIPPMWIGARKRPDIATAWLASNLLIYGLVIAGLAAPHQFPYHLFVGVPAALLLSHALGPRWSRRWVTGLLIGLLVWALLGTGSRLTQLQDHEPRAIDTALDELERPWSCTPETAPHPGCTGDALVLLAPAGTNDDDKRRLSTVLWRLSPWSAMPRVQPYGAAHQDYLHGQPRLADGFVVYVHDQPRPSLEAIISAHARVSIVVYEQGQRTPFTTALSYRLGIEPEPIGPDLLFRTR